VSTGFEERSMALREELARQGNWLFRWRSYCPLLIVPLFLVALYTQTTSASGGSLSKCQYWEAFCFVLSLLGFAIRCLTVAYVPSGTSGRNTKEQIASELNTTGIYSIVRHPLYLGNLIMILGLLLFVRVWWFALIGVLMFWIYYERIAFAEEEFLREEFGSSYLEWTEETPAFLPRFRNWKQPGLSFSIRKLLRREYHGFFAIIASFTCLDILQEIIVHYGNPQIHLGWVVIFAVGLISYLTLNALKKKTRLLDEPGR
jgi:protein-S-isoprenylcysteine O-methyltransferase Ste14